MENYVKYFKKTVLIFKWFNRKFYQNLYESKNGFLTIKLDIKSKTLSE